MKSIKVLFAAAVAAASFGFSNVASASIIGDSVNVSHYHPNSSSVDLDMGTQVVPTGVFDYYGLYGVTVNGDNLTYSSGANGYVWFTAAFNGPVITDMDSTFTSAVIDASSSYAGFDASRLSFDDHHIYLNLNGLQVNGFLQIDFETASTSDVPEPASMALFGLGMLGFAAARRKSAR